MTEVFVHSTILPSGSAVSALRLIFALPALLLVVASACGGGGDGGTNPPPPPPPPGGPVTLAMASSSGNAQTGTVGAALASPIRVIATRSGQPASGVTVSWATSGTGAALTPPTSVTDNQGIASSMWTLPQTAGPRNATASSANATGSPVNFTATATASAAAKLVIADGNNQTGNISAALGAPIRARVTDQFDNNVAGTSVAWSVATGSGAVGAATSITDAFGVASASWTLGAALGAQTAQATKAGLTGSPLTFTATATTPPIGGAAAVVVGNNIFTPSSLNITVGTTVTWTWTGGVAHGVFSVLMPQFTNSTNSNVAGHTYAFTFNFPGVYQYVCSIHGSAMSGVITVQ